MIPVDAIQDAIRSATPVRPKAASEAETSEIGAAISKCHENCAAWIKRHPEDRIIRGWIIAAEGFAARHSIIERKGGTLLDVTPREVGQSANIFDFAPWHGSEEDFWLAPEVVRFVPVGGWHIPEGFDLPDDEPEPRF